MTAPVFYAPEVLVGADLVSLSQVSDSTDQIVLGGEEGRHASKVQRIRPGERVDLVDGNGLRVVAEAVRSVDQGLEVRLIERKQEPARTPTLVLVQALAKNGRDEQAVETATELGVDQVVPWQADRSIVKWSGSKAPKALERWNKILVAAMKQSRRAVLPTLSQPVSSAQLADSASAWTNDGDLVLICHEEATNSLSEELFGIRESGVLPRRVVIVVGPEGGVSPEELSGLKKAGANPVLLGNEVLRSSTAGPAALIAANLVLGRW